MLSFKLPRPMMQKLSKYGECLMIYLRDMCIGFSRGWAWLVRPPCLSSTPLALAIRSMVEVWTLYCAEEVLAHRLDCTDGDSHSSWLVGSTYN